MDNLDPSKYCADSGEALSDALSDALVHAACETIPGARKIDLSGGGPGLTRFSLHAIAESCRALEELILCGCGPTVVSDAGVRALALSCREALRTADLSGCDAVGDGTLRILAGGAPRLRTLRLVG